MGTRSLVSFGLLFFLLPAATAAADGPPNVVLITLDTVRADHLGCYGYTEIRTPNVDRLAAEGVRFARAYTPVPITLPSHAVMFTGSYPMRTGMHDFTGNRLNPRQLTLASLLHERGYATGGITGAAVLDSRFGLNRGFDFYYDNFDFSRLDETNLEAMERPGNQVVDQGLAWLDDKLGKPFFLWLHLYDPHHPYRPPAPYNAQYAARPYDGEIAFADAQVGRVVQYLKEKKLYDKTLIVVVGDHGEGLGEHGEKTHGFFIYRSTLHVPLILKLPAGQPAAAKVVAEPVSLVDLLPTVLELAGARPEASGLAEVQGRSLVPLVRGRVQKAAETLYAETYLPRIHFNWSELRGVQAGRYKFIDAPRPELYDLTSDPGEKRNLFAERKAVANDLRKRLAQVIQAYTGTGPTAEKTALDPVLAERLKSLGYVAVASGSDAVLSDRNSADPKDRIQMFELVADGLSDSQAGRYAAAVNKLQAALKIEKDSLPVHYLLALNFYRQGNYPAAIEELQQVLRMSPDYSLAVYHLGLAYGKSGDWDQAIAYLQRALELDGTNFSAAFNLGAAYLKKRQIPESLAAFQRSTAIFPEYAPGYEAAGEVLLFQGQLDQAIGALRRAVTLAPGSAKTHRTLARALQAKGLEQEAQEELKKANALSPPQ